MKTPKISVIMGIYNCEATLEEAMESLFAQTYQDFEIILCDDGSTDGTRKVAEKYVQQYPDRVRLLVNEHNLGLNKTLNKCLKAARGEYFARMDGDDISLPSRFEEQVEFLDNHPEFAIVGTPMIFFDDSGDWGTNSRLEYPTVHDFYRHSPFFCHATVMVRREAYVAVEGYSEDSRTLRFEDCHLWYKMYAKGYRGYNIQHPLYKMRDDKNAFKRKTLRSRMNACYVQYCGYKMLGVPSYQYARMIKTFFVGLILGLIPESLYIWLHKKKMNLK